MNKISAEVISIEYGYDELNIVVNGKPLGDFLYEKTGLSKTKGLYPAWCNVGDVEWTKWISENWNEEKMRRLHNYTYKYYQNDENIEWYEVPRFKFLKEDYIKCLERFRKEL